MRPGATSVGVRAPLAVLVLACLASPVIAQDSLSLLALPAGPHDVGFRSVGILDSTRPYATTRDPDGRQGRPIQMLLFYPARKTDVAPASLGDYVVADWIGSAERSRWDSARAEAEAAAARAIGEGLETPLTDTQLRAVLDWPGLGRPEATAVDARFRLVLFESGLRARGWLYTPLCELLASHGFVVASLASLGRSESAPLEFDLGGIEAQAADIERALAHLATQPLVEPKPPALVAWSVGGVSQSVVRLRRPEFAAAVSLDSGTGYDYSIKLLRESGALDPRRLTIPFLQMDVGMDGRFKVPRDSTFFDAHAFAPALALKLPRLRHSDLSTSFGPPRLRALRDPRSEAVFAGYRAAGLYLLRFLEAFVMEKAEARRFLASDPAALGLAEDVGVVARRGLKGGVRS